MKNSRRKKQLAKIYYQNREVKNIEILFDVFEDEHYTIDIGPSTHISGKRHIIMDYILTKDDFKGKEQELPRCLWEIEDHLDKVQVNHMDSGIMIEWLTNQEVKSSLFIPMVRILHINVDDPVIDEIDEDDKQPKEVISK